MSRWGSLKSPQRSEQDASVALAMTVCDLLNTFRGMIQGITAERSIFLPVSAGASGHVIVLISIVLVVLGILVFILFLTLVR